MDERPAASSAEFDSASSDDVRTSVDFYNVAESLEEWLGDPEFPHNTLSFSRALEMDEREEMPSDAIARLRQFGLQRYWVPVSFGGQLRSCEELLMYFRVLARRDMNVAVSEATQIWMMLMWIGGDAEQRHRISGPVLRGEVIPCLAYSEAAHGADLAANDFVAVRRGDEYVLSGQKWPINRAATSTHVLLLARTDKGQQDNDVNATRNQSLFLVEKESLLSGEISPLPRVATYGLRGCDISGVSFSNGRIASSARLGAEGEGLELALRGLYLTRTLCTGLSLGVGDTMLRVVSEYLSQRMLYGGPTSDIPYVTESLANTYLSLLIAECTSIVAMRGMHLYPGEFSIWGNLAKVEVARLVEYGGKVLARALGARFYMRAEGHQGIFQKMLRDGAVVSLFDGSEPVCLDSVALQLPSMAKAWRRRRQDDWRQLYDLRVRPRDFSPERIAVFGRGKNAVFASLPDLRSRLDALGPSLGCSVERLATLRMLAADLQRDIDELFASVDGVRQASLEVANGRPPASAKITSPQLIRLAERCCALHSQVACLGMWLFNRDHLDVFFADGEWLEAALARKHGHQFDVGDLSSSTTFHLFARLRAQQAAQEFFSILPIRQAARGSAETGLVPELSTAH